MHDRGGSINLSAKDGKHGCVSGAAPVTSAPSFMKILVVGSGGREHALAWKLKQ